jgi:hypothetical protein
MKLMTHLVDIFVALIGLCNGSVGIDDQQAHQSRATPFSPLNLVGIDGFASTFGHHERSKDVDNLLRVDEDRRIIAIVIGIAIGCAKSKLRHFGKAMRHHLGLRQGIDLDWSVFDLIVVHEHLDLGLSVATTSQATAASPASTRCCSVSTLVIGTYNV